MLSRLHPIQLKRRSSTAISTHRRARTVSVLELHRQRHRATELSLNENLVTRERLISFGARRRHRETRSRLHRQRSSSSSSSSRSRRCRSRSDRGRSRRSSRSRSGRGSGSRGGRSRSRRSRGRSRTATAAAAACSGNCGHGRRRHSRGLAGDAQLEHVNIAAVTGAAAAGPHPHRHTPTDGRSAQLIQPDIAVGAGHRVAGIDHTLGGGAVHAANDRVAPAPQIERPITALRTHIEPIDRRTRHRPERLVAHRHHHHAAVSLRRHTSGAHVRVRQRARDERSHVLAQHRITGREQVRALRAARRDPQLKRVRDRRVHTLRQTATRVREMIQRLTRPQDQLPPPRAVLMEQARAGMTQEPDQGQRHLGARDARTRPEHPTGACQNVIASQGLYGALALLVQIRDVIKVGGTRTARQIQAGHTSGPVQEQRHLRTRHLRPGIEPLSRPTPGDPVVRETVDRSLSTQTSRVLEPRITGRVAHTRREHRQHISHRPTIPNRRSPDRSRNHNPTNQTNHQQHTPQQTRLTPTAAATGHTHQPAPPRAGGTSLHSTHRPRRGLTHASLEGTTNEPRHQPIPPTTTRHRRNPAGPERT